MAKVKLDSKEAQEHSLVKNKHRTLNGGQKRTLLDGQKERKGRKACLKGNDGFQKSGFRTYQPEKGAGNGVNPHKGRGKDQKERVRKVLILNLDFQPRKKPSEEGYGHAWEPDDWSSSHWPDNSSTSASGWSCTSAQYYQPDKGAGQDYTRSKAEERTKTEKAKRALILNLDFQSINTPMKKIMVMPGSQTTGLPAIGLTSP